MKYHIILFSLFLHIYTLFSQTIMLKDSIELMVYESDFDSTIMVKLYQESGSIVTKLQINKEGKIVFGDSTYLYITKYKDETVTITSYDKFEKESGIGIFISQRSKVISTANYKNEKLDGYFFIWENGNIKIRKEYKEGIEYGEWLTWYSNGNIRTKGSYFFEIPVSEQYEKEYDCCICLDYGEEIEGCKIENCHAFISEETCRYIKPKHGNWYYYNIEGKLKKITYYNMGKIEKVENY